MNRNLRTASVYLLLILVALSLISFFGGQSDNATEIDYFTFKKQLKAGLIRSATLQGQSVTGEYTTGEKFETYIYENDPSLLPLMEEKGVKLKVEPPPSPPWWTAILSYAIPFILFMGIWFFFMHQTQAGGNRVMSFGKSRARLHDDKKKRITFADVAGYEEVKEELQEVVEFLKQPRKFISMGARIPKGVLLFGPPGTGKTYMARAVAGEAGVPFFSISGSDFVEMFVGVGASRVRDLFETAKKNSPCIVFIDEIDAVGRQRGAGLGGGHDEREQTLNQLLVEMDGFEANEGIIVMAATNRPDILDPALLRPGRFDRQVMVGRPNIAEREAILKIHASNKPLAEGVDLETLARRTPGFTGADLENLLNEAALLAARRDKDYIEMDDLEEAVNRIIAGPEKKARVISPRQKKVVAYHEAGHALVAHFTPHMDPVHMVSIIPRGQAGGITVPLPRGDRSIITKSELLDRIAYALGGRIAEELIFGEMSTGASDDLDKVTSMARQMVTKFGMSEKLGPLTFGSKEGQIFLGKDLATERNYSEEVAAIIDKEVHAIVEACYSRARNIIEENIDKLKQLAQALIDKETLKANDVEQILGPKAVADSEEDEDVDESNE